MCKAKADGDRCFYHAWLDFQENAKRIERDERILANGQKLTEAEEAERMMLADTDPEALTQKAKNRLSVLERIRTDDSALTATEIQHRENNLARREELEASLNSTAVVDGASKRKELSLIRGDVLVEFARSDPNAKKHRDAHTIREFLERVKDNPDTPLKRREIESADRIYLANPERFNGRHDLTDGNGRRSALTADKFKERVELVRRYEVLNPALANPEHRNAHIVINNLRKTQKAFRLVVDSVILRKPLPEEVVAALPKVCAVAYRSGKLTPRTITLAIEHDERMAVYAFYAERAKAYPRLYANSTDREAMDAARKLIRVDDPKELSASRLAARQRRVEEWTARIHRGEWARQDEVTFATIVPTTQAASTTKSATKAVTKSASASVASSSASSTKGSPKGAVASTGTQTHQKTTAAQTRVTTRTTPAPAATAAPSARSVAVPSSPTPPPLPTAPLSSSAHTPIASPPVIDRGPALPERLATGASLERPAAPAVAPTPVADAPVPERPQAKAPVAPPPVIGNDVVHRLQRLFKRGK